LPPERYKRLALNDLILAIWLKLALLKASFSQTIPAQPFLPNYTGMIDLVSRSKQRVKIALQSGVCGGHNVTTTYL
jgi:hypothetical protein